MFQGPPRLAFPHRLHGWVEQTAEQWGIDSADVVELVMAAGLPAGDQKMQREAEVARYLCRRFEAGEALERGRLSESLAEHAVGLLRLGPVASDEANRQRTADYSQVPRDELPLEHPVSGYPRRWMGMAISDSPLEVWQAGRGYWRLKNDLRYLVPTRFGYVPYVFRVERWARYNSTKLYAAAGWLIYPEAGVRRRLIDPEEGGHLSSLGEPEPAEVADLTVAHTLAGQLLRLGPRGTNPVIRL